MPRLSRRRSRFPGAPRIALAAALLVATLPGCDPSLFKKTRGSLYEFRTEGTVKMDVRSIHMNFKAKSGRAKEMMPTMPVLRFQAKKDGSGQFGFVRGNHSLLAPFCFNVTLGNLDPSLPLGQSPSFGALELGVRDSDPLTYYGIGVQFNSGGAQAFGYKNGSSNIGTLDLSGATKVDVGFYTSGSSLFYMARESGVGSFTTFASTTRNPVDAPLVPSLGGANLAGGTGFSFGMPSIDFNALPGDATLEDRIAGEVDCAWEAYMDFCDAAAVEDYEEAEAAIADALEYLDYAMELTGSISDLALQSRLTKTIQKAMAGFENAQDMLMDNRPFKKINKLVLKSMDRATDVYPLVRPFRTNL